VGKAQLTPKEICDAVDIPGTISDGVTDSRKRIFAQPPYPSADRKFKVRKKVDKVLFNGYVRRTKTDNLRSLLYMFDVSKGESVYDGSKSGLNDCTWAPWFPLPTVETMC